MNVVICTPFLDKPHPKYEQSLEECATLIESAHSLKVVFERHNPYISAARATMLRKALDGGADAIVFIDYDLSWKPKDLLKLIQTEGDVVAGTYRFKKDDEEYMGAIFTHADGRPVVREDGCIKADRIPAGFMKITREGVRKFMRSYPELTYGDPERPSVDLFNHGAKDGVWWGEDYAFSRNWLSRCGDIWIVPDMDLDHHSTDKSYPGNFHRFLLRQPGGSEHRSEQCPAS